jgi:hypothetical protein
MCVGRVAQHGITGAVTSAPLYLVATGAIP